MTFFNIGLQEVPPSHRFSGRRADNFQGKNNALSPQQLYRKEPDMKPTYDSALLSTIVKHHHAQRLLGVSAVVVVPSCGMRKRWRRNEH